jgi:hypothetical protein
MAIAHVATTSAGSTGGNGVTSSAIDTTDAVTGKEANLIVVSASWFNSVSISVTDSQSNTWTPLTQRAGTGGSTTRLYYCASPTVNANHTFTITGASSFPTIGVVAVSGAAAAPFDRENGLGAGTNGSSIQPGSITPSVPGCLVITSVCNGGSNITINGGYTASTINNLVSNHFGGGIARLIQTAPTATNPTWSWTTSGVRASAIASFKPLTGDHGPSVSPAFSPVLRIGFSPSEVSQLHLLGII